MKKNTYSLSLKPLKSSKKPVVLNTLWVYITLEKSISFNSIIPIIKEKFHI